jgi:3D (Asp-Asp-Asp) domain-containing protein
MKRLLLILMTALVTAPAGFAREQTILARITVYWPSGAASERASSNGAKLRNGHCAVDPKKIPYGSKVIFPDLTCLAIDSGPAVISRLAARTCARTPVQRDALVIDRYFESRVQALAWAATHPHFMTVRVTDQHHTVADSNPTRSDSRPQVGPGQISKADGEQSHTAQPSNCTRSSAVAPAEVREPLLMTPSGTALPRS